MFHLLQFYYNITYTIRFVLPRIVIVLTESLNSRPGSHLHLYVFQPQLETELGRSSNWFACENFLSLNHRYHLHFQCKPFIFCRIFYANHLLFDSIFKPFLWSRHTIVTTSPEKPPRLFLLSLSGLFVRWRANDRAQLLIEFFFVFPYCS